MRVLVACEFSGIVRDAFARRGHDAWSCDILPSERPGQHVQWDVTEILDDGWDLMIGHPPCTFLANSGARWLYTDTGAVNAQRWGGMLSAVKFFLALWNAPIPRIALENPVMHKHGKRRIGVQQTQSIQPYEFGHPEQKRTCLWLKNLPPLQPTKVVFGRAEYVHRMAPGPDRWRERSRTYQGIADAMAEQWG